MMKSNAMSPLFVLLAATLASAGTEQRPAARSEQAATKPAPSPAVAPEIRVVTTAPIHALVLPMKGSYAQHEAAFQRLAAFLGKRGAQPTGAPFGLYHSDPSVGEANLVWEVGLPVAASVTAEAPFAVKDIPGASAAVLVHKGPHEELGQAWPRLIEWVFANGHTPIGPAIQIYQGDPVVNPQVELRMPIAE
jgi:effector-binding domain-containing protein